MQVWMLAWVPDCDTDRPLTIGHGRWSRTYCADAGTVADIVWIAGKDVGRRKEGSRCRCHCGCANEKHMSVWSVEVSEWTPVQMRR